MTKAKSIFLILIILLLVVFASSFIYWLMHMKTEPRTTPATEQKVAPSTLTPVEPTKGGGGSVKPAPAE